MQSPPLLEMRGIRKKFGGVEVLHGVDFSLARGEVVALMGENGAGKSTLMKILNGDYARDGGEIRIEGRAVDFRSPREAEAAGVRVIYQELNSAPDLSVTENVLLGRLPRKNRLRALGIVDWAQAHRRASQVLEVLKADIDPRELVGRLSVGQQQLVEIAKALSGQARILVMDEPTAALTSREVSLLFETIQSLRAQGVGIVYISHRLDEVEQIAGRVAVLRDGHAVGDAPISELSRGDIVRLMVGRNVESLYPVRHGEAGQNVLEVAHLSRPGRFEDVSFHVRAGEIVGLYGLLGAGQMEVVRSLFGSPPAASGRVRLAGREARLDSPTSAKSLGVGFVSEDRKAEGLILAIKRGDEVLYASLYWRARYGVNNLARVHLLTPRFDRIAIVRQQTIFEPSGLSYKAPNRTNMAFADWGPKYPGQWQSAHEGEELPIAKIPHGIGFKPGDENAYAGKAQFYHLRYGPYLIGMNTTKDKTFDLQAPSRAQDLASKKAVQANQVLKVGPGSTIVLYVL